MERDWADDVVHFIVNQVGGGRPREAFPACYTEAAAYLRLKCVERRKLASVRSDWDKSMEHMGDEIRYYQINPEVVERFIQRLEKP